MFEKSIFCAVATLASLFFSGSSSFLVVTRITTISRMSLNFDQIRPLTAELAAPECLKNQYFFIVATLAPSILIGSSSFLVETRITLTSWMNLNLSQIRSWTAEFAALECLKNQFLVFWPLQHLSSDCAC